MESIDFGTEDISLIKKEMVMNMIVVRIYEGVGNQMFQYAYAYALSINKEYKDKIYLDVRDEAVGERDRKRFYRPLEIDQFQISLPQASPDILKKWDYIESRSLYNKAIYWLAERGIGRYKIYNEDNYNFDKKYLKPKDNSYIMGSFQHDEYFNMLRPGLVKEFTLKKKLIIPAELETIMNRHEVVSIHIRRGDYVNDRCVRKVMGICNEKYYNKAVEYIMEHVKNVYLFVFTDDEQWVKDNLDFKTPHIIISGHFGLSDVQELVMMSKCRHNIIANSTFSWWGAWLNNNESKIVVAPGKWFRESGRKNIAVEQWVTL